MFAFVTVSIFVGQTHAEFRGHKFGCSFEEIIGSEKASFIRSSATTLIYRDSLLGFDSVVLYHLSPEGETLRAGSYSLDTTGYEIDEIMDHYIEVVEIMNEKYGRSLKKNIIWWQQHSEYKDDLVNAFRFGEASFCNEWYGPGVHVSLSLSNELNSSGKVAYRIVFEPGREYDPQADLKKL